MKKSILVFAAVFSFAVLFTSCKEVKKEEVKTEMQENHEGHDHDADKEMASKDAYQCPMDCEKGKTYDEKGSCPVCKMDLKAQDEHPVGCKCKEGGECKCAEGKCTCKKEVAKVKMECTHCEPGTCECKA